MGVDTPTLATMDERGGRRGRTRAARAAKASLAYRLARTMVITTVTLLTTRSSFVTIARAMASERGTPIDLGTAVQTSKTAHQRANEAMRTENYYQTTDERELFATLGDATVVLALLIPDCELCANYAQEFRYVAELFARSDADGNVDAATPSNSLVFIEVPDARATPNATGAFNAKSAPFVALLKKNRWYYVTPQGETKIREPKRFKGALNAKETVEWLNYALGRKHDARVSVPPVVDELTMETIDEYIVDDDYDVVVEFYAKWCGHCQAFEKDYEQIGAHYFRERRANNRRVKIARIDVDNARPAAIKYNITGLPTVQLFPRGHKTKGLPFKGSKKTTQLVIDFIDSPGVALYEMKIKDMEPWQCFDWLREEQLIEFDDNIQKAVDGEKVTPAECDDIVNSVFNFAQARANRQQWREAMVITMCMAATKELKNTPSGNSAAMWNLLDNAKFHVENPSTEDDEQAREAERAKYRRPDGEMDWEAFRSDQAEAWRREREKHGLYDLEGEDDAMFDEEEWFDFASPEEGGARVEIPEIHRDEL